MNPRKKGLLDQVVSGFQVTEIRHYDQGADPRLKTFAELTGEGWCAAMSVHWIGKKKLRQEFWKWQATGEAEAVFRTAMARFKVITEFVKQSKGVTKGAALRNRDADNRYADYMRRQTIPAIGRIWDFEITPKVKFSWEGVGQAIQNLNHEYFVIAVEYTDGAAHATAAHKLHGGRVEYFDPNFGEYLMDLDVLPDFLELLQTSAKILDPLLSEPGAFGVTYGGNAP